MMRSAVRLRSGPLSSRWASEFGSSILPRSTSTLTTEEVFCFALLNGKAKEKMGRPNILRSTHADGGCLGTGCRGRTRKAAKVVGEPPKGCDPSVSEWGNPYCFIAVYSRPKWHPSGCLLRCVEGTV